MKWPLFLALLALLAQATTACGDPTATGENSKGSLVSGTLDSVRTGSTCGDGELPVGPPFDPAASQPGTLAIAKDDSRIVGFATVVYDVDYGEGVDARWKAPEKALGPAQGNSVDVTSLGEGGVITLGFDEDLSDKDGPELCVFENSFSDDFLELSFVEVASSNEVFIRFNAVSFTKSPVADFGTIDPTNIEGFAGKYRQGYCTPFDLGTLRNREEVASGKVDLSAIRYVRIQDVKGDGGTLDCNGSPIYDPYPTTQSAGFDLDAIARF